MADTDPRTQPQTANVWSSGYLRLHGEEDLQLLHTLVAALSADVKMELRRTRNDELQLTVNGDAITAGKTFWWIVFHDGRFDWFTTKLDSKARVVFD